MSSTPPEDTRSVSEIRAVMRQPLSAAQRASYRGLTDVGMTGVKFEKLYSVATTEELIRAQQYGITLRPADDSGTAYLFAPGVGLVASLNEEYTAVQEACWEGNQPVEGETLAELDAKYKRTEVGEGKGIADGEMEELLGEVARRYLEWVNGLDGQ